MLYGRQDFAKMTSRGYDYVKGINAHFELALYVDTFDGVDVKYNEVIAGGGKAAEP